LIDCQELARVLPVLAKPPEIYSGYPENNRQRQATPDRQPDDGSISIRETSERTFHVIA
jgi:hypothetical protein